MEYEPVKEAPRVVRWSLLWLEFRPESDTRSGMQAENKAALQKELSLPERPEVPLIGFIGRLDYQKGADLVLGAVPWLLEQDVQLVCLGTGDVSLEVSRLYLCALSICILLYHICKLAAERTLLEIHEMHMSSME